MKGRLAHSIGRRYDEGMYRITIKEGKDKAPRRHHPWVFSGAIENIEPEATEADWAEVYTHTGLFIAYGWYDAKSHITLRLISWQKPLAGI